MKKILVALMAGLLLAAPASATVSSIKVCDSKTLAASTTTDCEAVEVPASRYFSYQVYCGETTDNSMSVSVDFVGGATATSLAVPSGVTQLKTAYATEDAWSAIESISTPLVPYGTIRLTENNGDADIVCSVLLNVSTTPNSLEDPVFQGTAVASGGLVVGETLGAELVGTIDATCTGWTLSGGYSCGGNGTIVKVSGAGGASFAAAAAAIGTTYKVVFTQASVSGSSTIMSMGGVLSAAYSAAGTYTLYMPPAATTAAFSVAYSGSTVVATYSAISVRAVTSTITPAAGSVTIYKELANATANENALVVTGNQTGAAGDKAVITANYVGTAGSGAEYLYRGSVAGTDAFNVTAAGALTLIGSAGGIVLPDNANSALYTTGRLNIRAASATLPMNFWSANDFTGTGGVFVFSQSTSSYELTGANVAQKYVVINPEYDQTGTSTGTDLVISRIETALGSGAQKFVSMQAGAAGTTEMYFVNNKGIRGGAMGSAVASATTIAPTGPYFHVTGTTNVVTITAPQECTAGCEITIIPDGVFATTTAGNIALASTAVVSKALRMVYDAATVKWYPSY